MPDVDRFVYFKACLEDEGGRQNGASENQRSDEGPEIEARPRVDEVDRLHFWGCWPGAGHTRR